MRCAALRPRRAALALCCAALRRDALRCGATRVRCGAMLRIAIRRAAIRCGAARGDVARARAMRNDALR